MMRRGIYSRVSSESSCQPSVTGFGVQLERNPRRTLEVTGVEFIDENGGGPGLRLRKRQRAKPAK
jgi:hypothetical protein